MEGKETGSPPTGIPTEVDTVAELWGQAGMDFPLLSLSWDQTIQGGPGSGWDSISEREKER